jgi:prepilin-type N-terminal cleavage/methylation domain-containing protein
MTSRRLTTKADYRSRSSTFLEQGFALIELLVVTTALAVIVGIVMIVITDASRRV